MILKPKLSNNIAMVLGGILLSMLGIGSGFAVGSYFGLIPGIFGLLGILWVCIGTLALLRRNDLSIRIDESGIELPAFVVFQKISQRIFIRRESIEVVKKHESVKGRLIEIVSKNSGNVFVQARHYCELNEFLSHCKKYGIPVA